MGFFFNPPQFLLNSWSASDNCTDEISSFFKKWLIENIVTVWREFHRHTMKLILPQLSPSADKLYVAVTATQVSLVSPCTTFSFQHALTWAEQLLRASAFKIWTLVQNSKSDPKPYDCCRQWVFLSLLNVFCCTFLILTFKYGLFGALLKAFSHILDYLKT